MYPEEYFVGYDYMVFFIVSIFIYTIFFISVDEDEFGRFLSNIGVNRNIMGTITLFPIVAFIWLFAYITNNALPYVLTYIIIKFSFVGLTLISIDRYNESTKH